MVQSLENIDKSKVSATRIEGLDEIVEGIIDDTLTGAVSTITTSDLTAGKILVSDNNGKVAAGSIGTSDIPDDSNVVHKTGNENIAGTKTFTDSMTTNNIYAKGNITLGTSTNTWGKMVNFQDTTGKRIARIQPMAVTTTNNRVGMWVNNADNTVEKGIYVDSDGTTSAPTPTTTTSTDNTQIATTGWVNKVGNNVIHKTGDETISGFKTFTGGTAFETVVNVKTDTTTAINLYQTDVTTGTAVTNVEYGGLHYLDKNGSFLAGTEYTYSGSGNTSAALYAYNQTGTHTGIRVTYPTNGNPYTFAPAPTDTTTTSGTQIATTGWVNSTGNNVVHLTDTETISGNKTFTGDKVFIGGYANVVIKNTTNNDPDYSDIEFDKANGTRIGNIRVYNHGKCEFEHFNQVAAPTPSSNSDYSDKIATTEWVKNSIRGKNLANNLTQKTGVITLNESIQNFPILLFGVGSVASYQYSTCVVTPFVGNRLNSYRDFSWQINGDTIRLNYTNGQTSATPQMITLKITSNVSVEIVTNTGNTEIRGIFGLSFN